MSNSMTPQEAIKVFEMMKHLQPRIFERNSMCEKAVNKAIKVLEYRIPKKPEQGTTNAFIYACPTCGGPVGSLEVEEIWCDFCPKCGQAIDKSLDWSDEE